MAAKGDKGSGDMQESEVWSAIAAFEQILEAIPNDRTSLETLSNAYEQIGDLTKAIEYSVRLADEIVGEADSEAAQALLPKLESFSESDPSAKAVLHKVQAFLSGVSTKAAGQLREEDKKKTEHGAEQEKSSSAQGTVRTPATPLSGPGSAAASSVRMTFNIASELPFAWNLLKSNELTQEEYSGVVQDLTDMSATDASVTVSVLHVLHDRAFKNLAKVLATAAKDCATPIISLSNFDLQSDAFSLLPSEFMVKRGVIIFDFFGDDALAVIMNPYDKQLMKDVEILSGRHCFFYLTQPSEFDSALGKINSWFEQQAQT